MIETQILLNGIQMDLSPQTRIALSYAVNNLQELKNKQGNFSNQITLPKTEHNRRSLEDPETDSGTYLPYQRVTARIIQGGEPVVSNGYGILDSTGADYKVTIYSGNLDFFELISGKYLSDLDLSDLDHVWNLTNVIGSRANSSGYLYPLVDYGKLTDPSISSKREIDPRYMRAYLFIHDLMSRIIQPTGFVFRGEVLSSDHYRNLILEGSTDPVHPEEWNSLQVFKVDKLFSQTITKPTTLASQREQVAFRRELSDPGNNYTLSIPLQPLGFGFYRAPGTGNFNFEIDLDVSVSGNIGASANVTLHLMKGFVLNPGSWVSVSSVTTPLAVGTSTTLSHTTGFIGLTFFESAFVVLEISGSTGNDMHFHIFPSSTFELLEIQGTFALEWGQPLQWVANVPKMSQTEFVKGVLNTYGLIPITNSDTREVLLLSFKDLYDNMSRAKDWTDRMDMKGDPQVTYRLPGWGQVNWFRYKEDETVPAGLGDGYIRISDETLPAEVETMIQPWAASEMVKRMQDLQVPLVKRMSSPLLEKFDIKTQTRILLLEHPRRAPISPALTYKTQGESPVDVSDNLPFAYFILPGSSGNLGFNDSLLRDHYRYLGYMLDRVKKIRAKFWLKPSDISSLDHSTPVYLKQFNNYFYINLVERYQEGKATEIELIRL